MHRLSILWGLYAVFIGVLLAGHLNSQFPKVFLPYELDYGEGIVLWQARHIFQQQHAYGNLDRYPYIVYHYPPLFHYASRLLAETGLELLAAGRLVSLLSAYGVVFLGGLLLYGVTPRRWSRQARCSGALVFVLFLYRYSALLWATVMRVDFLALFFVALGLYLFIRSPMGGRWQYVAVVFFALALYTKQTYVSAPVACLVAAIWVDRRAGLRRLWFLGIFGGVAFLLLSWWTDWGFPRHLFLYTQYPYSVRKFYHALLENTRDLSGLLPLACGALALAIGRWRLRWIPRMRSRLRPQPFRRALVIFAIYASLAGCLSITSGGAGSNVNYFIELNFACTTLAALFVAWAFQTTVPPGAVSPLVVVCVCLLTVSALPAGPGAALSLTRPSAMRPWHQSQSGEFDRVVSFVRSVPGPVLADDMVVLIAAGKEIPFEPIVVKYLAATGAWDETPLIDSISQRRYGAIVLKRYRESFFSPAAVSAMQSGYRESQQVGVYTVYLPIR